MLLDFEKIDQIKRLVIIALFSDDYLMDNLVLKGGNAIDLIYKISSRSSFDLDFSISGQFGKNQIYEIEQRIENTLKETFKESGYKVFDLNFKEKPKNLPESLVDFWGGYSLDFKFIENDKFEKFKNNLEALRRNAITLGSSTKCEIDISKFEYCDSKQSKDLEGYTIYVYSPDMIVFEKLRSICQQMPEYKSIVPSTHTKARAKDFFDIYTIFKNFSIDL